MTMSIDPRKGLHRNLNLLEAYQIYAQDYPLVPARHKCYIGFEFASL